MLCIRSQKTCVGIWVVAVVDVSENHDNMKNDKKTPLLALSNFFLGLSWMSDKMLNTHTGEERRGVILELRL
jgi:hypothetical protein